jgi:predicted transcriptional regulator
MNMTPQEFKRRRTVINLSQSEIARNINVSASSLSKFETGTIKDKPDNLEIIVRFLEQKEREVFASWKAALEDRK